MRSVNTVDSEGLKELMHTLDSGYTVVKRDMLMYAVNSKHLSIKTKSNNERKKGVK